MYFLSPKGYGLHNVNINEIENHLSCKIDKIYWNSSTLPNGFLSISKSILVMCQNVQFYTVHSFISFLFLLREDLWICMWKYIIIEFFVFRCDSISRFGSVRKSVCHHCWLRNTRSRMSINICKQSSQSRICKNILNKVSSIS